MRATVKGLLITLSFLVLTNAAYPQTTLTGAIQFSTNSRGAFYGNQSWNTLGGDLAWNLWLAHNRDASSPINGPSDQQAGINVSLSAGSKYRFFIFGAPDASIQFNGINLFFDGDNSTPGISVYEPTNSRHFVPNNNIGTRTLAGGLVTGSGKTFYATGDVVVVLTDYIWNAPATPSGDVCQAFTFAAGGGPSFFGSFTLRAFPAATLSLSQNSGPPGTSVGMMGSGFAPSETVIINAGQFGSSPIGTAVADASGGFNVTAHVPRHPYGPSDIFAIGRTSARLGASNFFVTPVLSATSASGLPGGAAKVQGFGFGAGEIVNVYWGNLRELIGAISTGRSGSFLGPGALSIIIPSNAPPGINAVIGLGQTTQALGIGEVIVQ